jgi:hypothetical protein
MMGAPKRKKEETTQFMGAPKRKEELQKGNQLRKRKKWRPPT